VGLGRVAAADRLLAEELELARAWGAPRLVGRTLRALGELRGDEAALREAVQVLAPGSGRLEHARAQAALAAVVGQAEAVPLLQEAVATAESCGAEGLRREAAAALRGFGIEVAEPVPGAVPLTTTERRIAQLHAVGIDVRTIAQTLFLTPLTVERTLAALRGRVST
jgi:DNA-binding NarL/FixJ family response regulator